MRTVKFEMQEIFAEKFTGHPSREDQDNIRKCKKAIIRLAELMDIKNGSHPV